MGNPFLDATGVVPDGPGRYRAFLDDSWNIVVPHGGIAAALALRAMAAELGDEAQALRSFHTTFAGQLTDGPVEVGVEVLRRGRSMSHLLARAANPGGGPGHTTIAAFGGPRPGFDFVGVVPPEVPPPAACPSFRDPPPEGVEPGFTPVNFWERRVEGRDPLGRPPWVDWAPGRPEQSMWMRIDEPPFLDDGTLDPLAVAMLTDMMPGAAKAALGPHQRDWFAPSVDLTVHLLEACRSDWVLGQCRAHHAGDGYASAEMVLWDCGPDGTNTPRPVAFATQVFLFSFPR